MKELYKNYKQIVLDYCNEFCKRHETEFSERDQPIDWLDHSVIFVDDMYINFDDIRYDVDNKVPIGVFESWYDRSSTCVGLDITYPNFPSYAKGAPHISDEDIEEIQQKHDRIVKMTNDLKQQIKEMNQNF